MAPMGPRYRKRKSNSAEILNNRRIPGRRYEESGENMLNKTTLIQMSPRTLNFHSSFFSVFQISASSSRGETSLNSLCTVGPCSAPVTELLLNIS